MINSVEEKDSLNTTDALSPQSENYARLLGELISKKWVTHCSYETYAKTGRTDNDVGLKV